MSCDAKQGDSLPIEIKQQGAIIVDNNYVLRNFGVCALVVLRTKSSHPDVDSYQNKDGVPFVRLFTSNMSRFTSWETPYGSTDVGFPTLAGWSMFSVEASTNEVCITFLKGDK